MKKTLSHRRLQKIFLLVFTVIFVIFSAWLFYNQQKISHYSQITTTLSSVQDNANELQLDIEQLQEYINNQDNKAISNYVATNATKHKKWLTELLLGAEHHEPLTVFGFEYLSLLLKLKVDDSGKSPLSHRKLLWLIEENSQPELNIAYLSRKRMEANLIKLDNSILLSDIIIMCLVFTFLVMLVFSYWRFSLQQRLAYKHQRLSLFFTDHPKVLLRVSANTKIKYCNKQAELLVKQKNIPKHKLLPANITDHISQAIKYPGQVIRYQHQIGQQSLDCELRFTKESQQIFVMMNQPQQMKELELQDLAAKQRV